MPSTTLNTHHYFPPSNFTYSWTLFSQFISSFSHGTCLLSVSALYLALEQLYVPYSGCDFKQPYSSNTCLSVTNCNSSYGTVTLYGSSFQMIIYRLQTDNESIHYNSIRWYAELIFKLGFFRFTRRYWGNRSYFLFLPLIICLNSGGFLTPIEII